MEKLKLPVHEHPLYHVGGNQIKGNDGYLRICDGCGNQIKGNDGYLRICDGCYGEGHLDSGYRCSDSQCQRDGFYLHKKCGDSVPEINHPSHPEHPLHLLIGSESGGKRCHLCGVDLEKLCYHCSICDFTIDTGCAINPPLPIIQQPKAHEHTLTLTLSTDDDDSTCHVCDEKQSYNKYLYSCSVCDLFFHIECASLSPEINHPSHPRHLLKMIKGGSSTNHSNCCTLCGLAIEQHQNCYHCSICNFTVDVRCVKNPPPLALLSRKTHKHELTCLPRCINFTCNACGKQGDQSPYVCFQCNFMIHRSCIDLPRVISINRHDHRIYHTYDLDANIGNSDLECGVCRQAINTSYGAYSCLECKTFVVHSRCATNYYVWDGRDLEGEPEENEDVSPFKVIVLHLGLRTTSENSKIFRIVSRCSGIDSLSLNGDEKMTVVGNQSIDVSSLVMKLRRRWPATEIVSVGRRERAKKKIEPAYQGRLSREEAFSSEKRPQTTKETSDSGLGTNITTYAYKYSAGYMRKPDDDWCSCKFMNNRIDSSTLSSCRADDAVDFLRMRQTSGDSKALVGHLSDAGEACGIKPKDNPFRSVAVTRYLMEEREMTRETKSILVFSFNDHLDAEKTSFIRVILTELYDQEFTPLTYNLSEIGNLDAEMLYRSSVGIMLISTSFASSSQSLDHLVTIMEHWKAKDLVIVPVYFKLTLLDDQCEALLSKYLSSVQAGKVQKWKAAITELASIDGHQWTKGTQFVLAKEVVRSACLRLYLRNSKNVVRILELLNHPQPLDADIEGIWGMAGIGKTSIAREVFEKLSPQYDLCYFLQDFHLICQSKGPRQLRDDFYSKLFGEEKPSISASDVKQSFMRDRFQNKTILVVLDDVSNARDAEAVVGGFGWFSHGHRIFLTSRRKQVLLQCKVKEPYEIQKLDEFESFRLCKQYLKEESAVISEIMSCSSGMPLALNVLASSVSKQHTNNMMEHLHSLRRNPPTQIQETFRRSFNELDQNEKNILLDLACFFRGHDKDHVVQLLDACGFFTYLGICDLIDESLISLLDNRIEIPIPFQDMGRFIVYEEDEDPCERSRLWDSNDIIDVLTNNSGTDAIEGIFLDAWDLTCELSPIVFSKMHRLRLLRLYCSTYVNAYKLSLPQGLDTLPDELRLLHWESFPLKYLPQKFNPENLVEVTMPYSNLERLWEGKKNLEKLRRINLSHSINLTDIKVLSESLNLEDIDLEGCTSLVDISTSIPQCGKLVSLNMKDCCQLRSLPAMVDLTSLKLVNLSGCSELKEIQDFAPNLKKLYLAGTAITELPLSIENLSELVTLDLENCRHLCQLPFGIRNSRSIVELKLSGCTSLPR